MAEPERVANPPLDLTRSRELVESWLNRIQQGLQLIHWSFGIARATCPSMFVWFGLTSLVMTAFPAGIALSIRGLVNAVSQSLDGVPLVQTGALFWIVTGLLLTIGTVIGTALTRYFVDRFEAELRYRLDLDIMQQHAKMPLERVEDQEYRNSLERARHNPEGAVAGLYAQSLELGTKLVQATSLIVILVIIEPLLFVLLLPIGLPYLVFQWRLSQRQFREMDTRVRKERWAGYFKQTLTDVDQAAEIRLLQLQPELLLRLTRIQQEFRGLILQHLRAELVGRLVFAVLSVVAVYLALTRAAFSIVEGQLTIGDLAIFVGAAAQLRFLIEQSVSLSASMRWKLLSVNRVREFFSIAPPPRAQAGRSVPRLRGEIEFRDVEFAYPGTSRRTLHKLSFRIPAGETVAIVGANGAGKSTIAKLVAGLYEIQSGSILYDGTDSRSIALQGVQRQVACVFQSFGRFAATAADNIAFGNWPELANEPDRVRQVAERAGLGDLIDRMPGGYQTVLGRGLGDYQPSGGQWQQIAIARAIARDASILILDEPTANLDVEAEAQLFQRFLTLTENRTTILISHRFSTVALADRILVIEEGQLIESGSHTELLANGGRYAQMHRLASRGLIPQ